MHRKQLEREIEKLRQKINRTPARERGLLVRQYYLKTSALRRCI